MSYRDAVDDGITIEKDAKGFDWYYPPCDICGTAVASWSYVRGTKYICKECRHELVVLKRQAKCDADKDKKLKKLKTAVKRISDKTNIKPYQKAIDWVEKNLHRSGWFQSTEEIMVALELIRRGVKAHHQVRIYDYFVDFVLPEYKVALEVDGKLFHSGERAKKERVRDEMIEDKLGEGWEVIRIDTENINTNITRLMPAIKAVLKRRKK